MHYAPYNHRLHQNTPPVLHISTASHSLVTVNSSMTTWENKHFHSVTLPLKSTDVTQEGVKYFVWGSVLTIVRGRPEAPRPLASQPASQQLVCCRRLSGQTQTAAPFRTDLLQIRWQQHVLTIVCVIRTATALLQGCVREPQLVVACDWFSALSHQTGAHICTWVQEQTLSGFINSVAWVVLTIHIHFY